jgi:nicotinamidase-related amidase
MPDDTAMLRPETVVLLVVDLQERMLAAIEQAETFVEMSRRMIEAAKVLDVPTITTEQYPAGLGKTHQMIRDSLESAPVFEKTRFSCCVEEVVNKLRELDRSQVILVGVEAHVCVQQTVLDLLRLGFTPYVCADGVASRRPIDAAAALERMRQAGAIITTTESVTFELLGDAGNPAFKQIHNIVK